MNEQAKQQLSQMYQLEKDLSVDRQGYSESYAEQFSFWHNKDEHVLYNLSSTYGESDIYISESSTWYWSWPLILIKIIK